MSKMLSHMAEEMFREQLMGSGMETFTQMGFAFTEEEYELLNEYAGTLVGTNMKMLEEFGDLVVKDDDTAEYVHRLLDIIYSLTYLNFINWGSAMYYKLRLEGDNDDDEE